MPDAEGEVTAASSAGPLTEATNAWWSYERPSSHEVETTPIEVQARDGTTIGVRLNRPVLADGSAPGPLPGLVVEFTPYALMTDLHQAEAMFFAERGYATAVGTVRGAGRSGGAWQHAHCSQDGRDAADVVEWLATQPFCDGRVGQFGESYGGQTSYGSAVERPPIEVPVLAIGGWNDGYFRSGTLDNIEGALERTWVIYGPWPHLPPIEIAVGFAAPDPLPAGVLLAWFDHWVLQLTEVPIPAGPTFVSFEGPIGTGRGWRELDGWDPAGADPARFALGADGLLGVDAPGGAPVVLSQPSEPDEPGGAVTFTSAPLAEDRVLLGRATVDLHATLTADGAHLYVELVDVDPGGAEVLVNDGFLAASHRASHVSPEPAPIGESVELRIDVRPAYHRFVAGRSVRVRVSGGGSDRLTPPPRPVEIRIATGTSTLRLPGFGR